MSDPEDPPAPKQKRLRGPYKKYLEPGQRLVVPRQTAFSRSQKEKFVKETPECDDVDEDLLPQDDHQPGCSRDYILLNLGDESLSPHMQNDQDVNESSIPSPDVTAEKDRKKRELSVTSDDKSSSQQSDTEIRKHARKKKGLFGQRAGDRGSGSSGKSSSQQSDTEIRMHAQKEEGLFGQRAGDGGSGQSGSSGESSSELSHTEETSGYKEAHGFSFYASGSVSDEEGSVLEAQAYGRDDEARPTVRCLAICTCGKCTNTAQEETADFPEDDGSHRGDALDAPPVESVRAGGTDQVRDSQEEYPTEENDPSNDRHQKWKRKHQWDEHIHPHLSVRKFAVFLMVFHLFVRHNMTYALVEDIFKFVNCILGSDVLSTSQYIFKKLFRPNCAMLTHVYCPSCEAYLGEINDLSPTVTCACGEESKVKDLKDSDHYFVTIGVADSLKYFMRRPNTKLMPPRAHIEGVYRDVIDGDIYRQKISPEIEKGKNVMSLTFNTDGAKVFKSNNKMSMWPIQFLINELDPRDRFKDANVFVAGMWYGRGAPNMSTFFRPMIAEIESLAERGVELVTSAGEKLLYFVYALICSVDSGAKPKLLRQKAGNGKCACGFCLHPNLPVPGYPLNQLRYVEKDRTGCRLEFSYRTHQSMITDMLKADDLDRQGKLKKGKETTDHVNGLLGISPFAGMPKFDLAKGFIIDYLHTLLLGIMSDLLKYLFDDKDQRSDRHNPSSQIGAIEKRLSSIKPPHCMATHSRLFSEREAWKGKELRQFALVYALPCLNGLPNISSSHFKHLQKFVTLLQILLGSDITSEQLLYAERLVDEFVLEFEDIYGAIHMSLNIHLFKHVVNVVRWWGPLWCYSNFAFESGNGRLARLVRGTQGVVSQICEKYLAVLTVSDFLQEYNVNQSVVDFCSNVMSYKYLKKSEKIDDSTRVLDGEKIVKLTTESEDKAAIMDSGIASLMEATVVQYYNRVIYKGTVYYSKAYTRPEFFDDTCVKLSDGTYAITEKFIKTSGNSTVYVIIRPIQLSANDDNLAPLILTGAFNFFGSLRVVEVKNIVKKCVCIQLENHHNYVCELPNNFERD